MRKTAFFELFVRRSGKSVRKQCFFHVFRDTLYKVRKNAVFSRFPRVMDEMFMNELIVKYKDASCHYIYCNHVM